MAKILRRSKILKKFVMAMMRLQKSNPILYKLLDVTIDIAVYGVFVVGCELIAFWFVLHGYCKLDSALMALALFFPVFFFITGSIEESKKK